MRVDPCNPPPRAQSPESLDQLALLPRVRYTTGMKKYLIPLAILMLFVIGFFLPRILQQTSTPPTDPPAVTAIPQPTPPPPAMRSALEPPAIAVAPPAELTAPVAGPIEQPPIALPPPEDPESLLRDAPPEASGQLDMAALFKEKMLAQVRAQTAAQHKIHYADFSAGLAPRDSQRLAELILQRRIAMVEVGIAAQTTGQQPDPAAIAGAYSVAEGDIQKLLGDQYQSFIDYEMALQDRVELDSIIGVFTSDEIPLTELQQEQVLALMQEEREAVGLMYRWDSPDAMALFQGNIPELLTKHHEMYKAINARVGELLSDRQAAALRDFYQQRLGSMVNALNALPRQVDQ